jgi:hypothetical protein
MQSAAPILHQAGVIPDRILNGNIQVLLMTSRDTGRRIVPKDRETGRAAAWMTIQNIRDSLSRDRDSTPHLPLPANPAR